ncbi:hypothetical protein ACFZ8E_24995 [Methylobacterium sp. HMF5984]|uniref:hypothetical protein n=1 Tax=Methylobacterium sp. HMF5984 TaxID=3367370 RepID=UPI0038527A7E
MAAFLPNVELTFHVEAHPIVSVGSRAVMIELPNGDTRPVPIPTSFGDRPPAVGDMLIRFDGGFLIHRPADLVFRDAMPLDANLVEAARPLARTPVVEEPLVPRRDAGLPHGRPHP